MRILITGASGFVGPHLVEALRRVFMNEAEILATALKAAEHSVLGQVTALDVTDSDAVNDMVERRQITHIVHLAGLAAIPAASADPQAAWRVHVHGTLNIAHAILGRSSDCVLLFVGSGQIYGASARTGLPLGETTLLAPVDDYSVTKAAADLALGALAKRGLRCIRMRPFNHTGPGQGEGFVVPSFAMQIARIEAGLQQPIIRVGNLDAERDFLDVRDVSNAYALSLLKSHEIAPGTILNVASGTAYRVRDILHRLLALTDVPIRVEQDPARMRPSDLPRIVGDAALARRLLGWAPKYAFDDTLADMLADCRERISGTK
ncbi:MAG: NAD-dependent epimerase/dehydratase family protein [Alphaproteobacteria bacterium]|nr:NAD-dependent epimerase/dehydratase family protein [Alphaproteobacteria bacterium]